MKRISMIPRTCNICGITKPESDFYLSGKIAGVLRKSCKDCYNEANKYGGGRILTPEEVRKVANSVLWEHGGFKNREEVLAIRRKKEHES